jgi:hypothetical protein
MLLGIAHIAQLVERGTANLRSAGSIRASSIILPYYNLFAETLMYTQLQY